MSLLLAFPDFPASDGWVVTFTLLLPASSADPITIGPSEASGAEHSFLVDVDATQSWPAGLYSWVAKASYGTTAYTVGAGTVTIAPGFAAGVDPRSHAEKCLAAITAVIEGRSSDPIAEYKIGDREAKRYPLIELIKLQTYWSAQVRRARGESPFKTIPLAFTGGRFSLD